jgi:uncharacterized repeat protein (TIGR01451 family)
MKNFAVATLMGLLLSGAAIAGSDKQAVKVGVQVLSEKEVTDTSGNIILERVPLDVAIPNQTVIYKITVHNSERETVSNVALNIPVSDSLLIKPGSFTSDIDMNVTFSLDGVTFDVFDTLKANEEDTARQAVPEDIKAVRIDIPELPRDETYFIEYDAVVR